MDIDNLLVYLVIAVAFLCGYLHFVRNPIRRERLKELKGQLGRLNDVVSVGRDATQAKLQVELDHLRSVDSAAALADKRARSRQLARPDVPTTVESEDTLVSKLIQIASDRRIVLGVAGGEQLVGNLFDMAQPDALAHLGDACKLIGESGMVGIIIEGARHGLRGAATEFASHVGHVAFMDIAHGAASEIARIPGEVVHSVIDAGHHVGQSFNLAEAHGAHFPWVTLALSTIREGALLFDNKTTLDTALGHVLVDTGATAGGSWGGAHLGAATGTLVAPGVGTAVGAVIGGVIGAVVGRQAARAWKFRPLKQAMRTYDSQAQSFRAELRGSAHSAVCRVAQHSIAAEQRLHKSLPPVPRAASVLGSAESVRGTRTRLQEIRADFGKMRKELIATADSLERVVPKSRWFHYIFLTGVEGEGMKLIRLLGDEVTARIEALEARIPRDRDIQADPIRTIARLAHVDLPSGSATRQRLLWWTEMMKRCTQDYLATIGIWSAGVASAFGVESEGILTAVGDELARHRKVFETGKLAVEQCHAQVVVEQRQLGFD